MSLATLAFGGDYNPQQWSEDVWGEDYRLFDAARIDSARITGDRIEGGQPLCLGQHGVVVPREGL